MAPGQLGDGNNKKGRSNPAEHSVVCIKDVYSGCTLPVLNSRIHLSGY